MIRFLVKTFIKDYENTGDRKVRERYTTLSGGLGILCNAALFALKLTIGLLTASIAVTSDAFNNLSDMGTSAVSVISAKLSNKNPDRNHPFGHGRIEYVSSLIMSFLILIVGVELLSSSVKGIIRPQPVSLTVPLLIILLCSVLVKVWMFFYNRYLGREIRSTLLLATAQDSLSDCISTASVAAASFLTMFFSSGRFEGTFWGKIPFDGIIGVIVSLLILWNGVKMAAEVVGLLLGRPPEQETVCKLEEYVLGGKNILGFHDLMVHDYGPGRVFASAHAEVPYNGNVMELHETIDEIEQTVKREMGIVFVLHMDPVVHDSERVNSLKELTAGICRELNPEFSIHDFRITDGENRVNLIFDMKVPPELKAEERRKAAETVKAKLKAENPAYCAVILVE